MANTDNPNGFKWIKNLAGGGSPTLTGYCAASATIAKGDAIIDNGSGNVTIALANSPSILGVAAESVSSATLNDPIKYYPATPWNVFEGQTSGTYAITMRFTSVDIEGATGVMEINEDATTELVARIIGENPNSEIGANTRVWFVFERSQFINLQDAEA